MTQRIRVRVKPGSRKGPLVEPGPDGVLTVFVRERAVDGAANQAVVAVLADYCGVRPRDVRIVSGHTARSKTVDGNGDLQGFRFGIPMMGKAASHL